MRHVGAPSAATHCGTSRSTAEKSARSALENGNLCTLGPEFRGKLFRRVERAVAMEANTPAMLRKIERQGTPDALRSAGNEGNGGRRHGPAS